jgi:hypothetical protein
MPPGKSRRLIRCVAGDHRPHGLNYAVSEADHANSEMGVLLEHSVISPLQMAMVDDAPRSFHFDTDDLPERDRFQHFAKECFAMWSAPIS